MINFNKAALFGLLALNCAGQATASEDSKYRLLEGAIVNHEDISGEDDLNAGVRIGFGFPFAGGTVWKSALEVGVLVGPIERHPVAKGTQRGLMVDVVQSFELGAVDPFVMGGVGVALEPDSGSSSEWHPAIEAGLGAMFGGNDLRFRFGVTAQEVFNDKLTPARDAFIDYRVSLAVVAPWGAAAPPPAPAKPVDSDGDGVPDAQDLCPTQPAPTADGCPAPLAPAAPPRDTDGDGIDDSQDECPGTLGGLEVDASGCVITAKAQKIVLEGVNFVTNSAQLTPDARYVLDKAHAALAGQPSLRVEVGGHTDSVGSDAANQTLSQRRAESVRKYLVDKGIDAGRLAAKGYGEGQPIADNTTKAGRTENRRVELKVLN